MTVFINRWINDFMHSMTAKCTEHQCKASMSTSMHYTAAWYALVQSNNTSTAVMLTLSPRFPSSFYHSSFCQRQWFYLVHYFSEWYMYDIIWSHHLTVNTSDTIYNAITFGTRVIKLNLLPMTWQSFTSIGRESSEISRTDKHQVVP